MKAVIKIQAMFSAEFEGEYSTETIEKLNHKAEKVRDAMVKVLGFDPGIEIHFDVTVDRRNIESLDDWLRE